jgi:hypothetical protein
MSSETNIQTKIIKLEEIFLKFSELNVRAQIKANEKKIDMRVRRLKDPDGFYMITLFLSYNDCHAILIYRKTQDDGKIIFYIYDPNGRNSAIKYDYKSNIACNERFEIDLSMTPEKSINEEGRCALWCIIVIILWNSFEPSERMIALNVFNLKMRENRVERTNFINDICSLLRPYKDITPSIVKQFIEQVKERIVNLSIKF